MGQGTTLTQPGPGSSFRVTWWKEFLSATQFIDASVVLLLPQVLAQISPLFAGNISVGFEMQGILQSHAGFDLTLLFWMVRISSHQNFSKLCPKEHYCAGNVPWTSAFTSGK